MAMGRSISPRRQASSHGAAQTRPQTEANGFGQPGRQIGQLVVAVGDRGHVHPGVGVDRAGGQARDVLVVELQFLTEDEIPRHQIRSVLCSQIRPPIPAASITIHRPDPIRSPTSRGAPAMMSWVIVQEGSQAVARPKNRKIKMARP